MTTDSAVRGPYIFDNATPEAARQVRLLAGILDPHTTDVLDRCAVAPGWQCLDLGAGAGTVAAYLAEQVSPGGHVVALDRDPRHIAAREHVTIRTADLTSAELGDRAYDLIHARLVFMHLPDRDRLLRRAAAALKPGGLLILSDWDCSHLDDMLVDAPGEAREAFASFQTTLIGMGVANGMSVGWARHVPAAMRAAGLVDVQAEVHNRLWSGGEPGCVLHACNSRQLEQPLIDHGMSRRRLTVLREAMDDPDVLAYSYPMYTTVGRRAES